VVGQILLTQGKTLDRRDLHARLQVENSVNKRETHYKLLKRGYLGTAGNYRQISNFEVYRSALFATTATLGGTSSRAWFLFGPAAENGTHCGPAGAARSPDPITLSCSVSWRRGVSAKLAVVPRRVVPFRISQTIGAK
jgi:hypothetical protein